MRKNVLLSVNGLLPAAGMGGPGQKVSGNEFRADHLFAFIISETSTGTILFIGQYTGK